MLKIGQKIYNAVLRSRPMSLNGTRVIPEHTKFSLKNPYILESLSDKEIQQLSRFEGQNLRQVCQDLDAFTPLKQGVKIHPQTGFSDSELKNLIQKAYHGNKCGEKNLDAMVYLSFLPGSIGIKFDAHGLAKLSIADQIRQLNSLLTKGIDKTKPFYTAPLEVPDSIRAGAGAAFGTAGGTAYRDGSFIITSGKGKFLAKDGIENVIVNDACYGIIEDLRAKFPHINFVKAKNAVEYFSKL